MLRLLSIVALCVLGIACAGSPKKKTTPERKDVNAEDEQKKKKEEQSYAEAWRRICHAERLAEVSGSASRQERATLVAEWITANVKNKKARYWWIAFGSLKKHEREAFFRRDAKDAGVDPCPLVDLLFSKGPQSAPASAPATK